MQQARLARVTILILGSLSFWTGLVVARPRPGQLPRFQELSVDAPPTGRIAGVTRHGITQLASQDTVFFGGTTWNAEASRWEALPGGMWTFDSGVGSHFDHSAEGVDPFKDPRLHAYMEGWVGIDNTYRDTGYLRLVSDTDPAWEGGAVCVGAGTRSPPGS
jgi:hypothetical protein